jgi:hypothetical protein
VHGYAEWRARLQRCRHCALSCQRIRGGRHPRHANRVLFRQAARGSGQLCIRHESRLSLSGGPPDSRGSLFPIVRGPRYGTESPACFLGTWRALCGLTERGHCISVARTPEGTRPAVDTWPRSRPDPRRIRRPVRAPQSPACILGSSLEAARPVVDHVFSPVFPWASQSRLLGRSELRAMCLTHSICRLTTSASKRPKPATG